MRKKIQDIKKNQPKHINVEQEKTKETHIAIHKNVVPEKEPKTKESALTKKEKSLNNSEKSTKRIKGRKEKREKDQPTPEKKISDINVVFMGTGNFASEVLKGAYKRPHANIVGIVTQPDKKIGRKKSTIHRTLAPNPVRDFAKENEIQLFQPPKIDEDAITKIKKMKPHIIVVASYGKLLPKSLLNLPQYGAINIHTSLLPKLRGASPVQNALLLGFKKTGVTIMQMDEGLDTGDILAQEETEIQEHEKYDELLHRLSQIAAKLIEELSPKYFTGEVTPKPQNHSQATLCQLIDREDGHIQWTETTQEIYNRYRALYPWPGIFSYWEEKENQMMRIKLRSVFPYNATLLTEEEKELQPGTVFIGRDQLCIKTFDGALIIEALQPECKVVMPIYDFINGHKTFEGSVLR
ncbi:MAG: methionyl-tRNA formyltransferase [Candidatus Moraniibacteriota bacterium]|nr:MAG: methionyl-tRNA formyltransferase [Candidatus Moranbacteria bacterium]